MSSPPADPQCALLVTAHPDDEAMFFAPLILALLRRGLRVALLCLSTGNADGLGAVRAQELYHACALLGVPRSDVRLVDDPRLQDGMQQRWPPDAAAEHVAAAAQHYQPSRVYTFDSGGVSGHPNHLAACAGVLRWWADLPGSTRGDSGRQQPEVWQLGTVGLLRKYLGPLDAPAAWLLSWAARRRGRAELQACWQPGRAWRALLAHYSQMVWYRRLWLLFSCYMYINVVVRRH